MVNGEYEFYDGLIYKEQGWDYCTTQDRSFYTEIVEGMQPNGHSLIVNPKEGPKDIPQGTYDVGDGYYDPQTNILYEYDI